MESLDHEITYLSILFKCYSPFSSQTTPPFSMTFGYQLHCIVSIKKLALVQVNIDRKLQGCKVPLIPRYFLFERVFSDVSQAKKSCGSGSYCTRTEVDASVLLSFSNGAF